MTALLRAAAPCALNFPHTMRLLVIAVLSLSLPGLALAAGPASFRAPSISLPSLPVAGPAASLPSPKLPVLTPAQIDAVYRLPAPTIPVIGVDGGAKLPPRKPGLPGEDDLLGGVPARLIPPNRPIAPAAAAAAIPHDEHGAPEAHTDDLMRQLEQLFDHKGGCWKPSTPVPAPAHEPVPSR